MNFPRYLRTVSHLKPLQIGYRLWWPLKPRRLGKPPAASVRQMKGDWALPVGKTANMVGETDFRLLNQDIGVATAAGWNEAGRDKLLLYHLHYMDDLAAADAAGRSDWHAELIDRWIADNPPCEGNGWEPYPLSLRIVNWVKWRLAGNTLSERQLESLWYQARILDQSVEYHLQANHLVANAKGLIFAGSFLAGREPDRWLNKGIEIFERQIEEQVLPDGGHFERSPMYQAILIEDFCDIINVLRAYRLPMPGDIEKATEKMLAWLDLMTHPDGQPAYFNDTVANNTATLVDLRSYLERLELAAAPGQADGIIAMPPSGYYRYRAGAADVFVDAGPIGPDYQPGHAHCDMLSFELSLSGRRVLVNTGISTYNDNARRRLERGTAAHNTVSIDGLEQSEIWSAFRVGRRARPEDVQCGSDFVEAAHNGYRQRGIRHRRRFDFSPQELKISDWLESKSEASGYAHFHCYPGLEPEADGQTVRVAGVRMDFDNPGTIEIVPYDYCREFNLRESGWEIIVGFDGRLETSINYEDPVHNR